jgi:hypothetical protein
MAPKEIRTEISNYLDQLSEKQLIEVLNYVKHIQQQLLKANEQSNTKK